MHLKQVIKSQYNESVALFAKAVGVVPATVYRWLQGTRRPGWDMMKRIRLATNDTIYDIDQVSSPVGAGGIKKGSG